MENEASQSHPSSYRPAVDGLRALAVVAVIVNHVEASWWPKGFLGVDVFFVISGFVVTLSLMGRSTDQPTPFLLDFYTRRVRRLFPALALTVVVTSLLAALVMYPGSLERITSLQTGITALAGVSNLFLLSQNSDYFGISSGLNLFLHTWSLGVEEQFYLVFPIIWLFSRGKRWLLALLVGVLVGMSFLFQVQLLQRPNSFNAVFYLMPTRFWELGAGALLALALPWLQRFRGRAVSWIGAVLAPGLLAMLVAILVSGFGQDDHSFLTGGTVLLTVALLLALEVPGSLRRHLGSPAPVAVGLRSYGLYLWHWPLLVLLRWTIGLTTISGSIAVLLTGVLAWVSFRWIETPLRRRRWRPRAQGELALGLAGTGLATGCLGLLLTPIAVHALWLGTTRPQRYVPPAGFPHLAYAPEVPGTGINRQACFERFSFTPDIDLRPEDLRQCRLAPLRPGAPTLYAYGDSYTGHLSPLLTHLRRIHGVGLEVLIRAQCPFPARRSDLRDDCTRFDEVRRQRVLASAQPGDVLLLATSAREPGGRYSTFFLDRLASLSRELKARGVRVIFQSPLPRFSGSFDPVCVYPAQSFQPGAAERCSTPSSLSRSQEWKRVEPLLTQLKALRVRDGLELWDAFTVLCPPGQSSCSTHDQGVRLYRDEGHLSGRGAERLIPSLEELLFRGRGWKPTLDQGFAQHASRKPVRP